MAYLGYICLFYIQHSLPTSTRSIKTGTIPTGVLFGLLWSLLFILYFPAAKAGFVADFTGWLDQVRHHSFSEFINRTHFQARSMYQFTQFNTWVFYKLLGVNEWLWHILFITLHAVNATMLYTLCRRLLADVGASKSDVIAAWGVALFCVSPYISEVVVWEPSFHFLQGLLLILGILLCAQQYIYTGRSNYAMGAIVIYVLSLFSLEIFYITPLLVLTIGLFYRYGTDADKKRCSSIITRFFLPMLLLLLLRFVGYRIYSGDWVSRIGSSAVGMVSWQSFSKPIKYVFHLLFVGRFFSDDARQRIYDTCESIPCMVLFYGYAIAIFVLIIKRFRTMSGKAKVVSLLFVWMFIALMLLVPLWFAADMLVLYDRYTYFAGAFFYMLFAILASFIAIRYVGMAVVLLFGLINLRFAIKVSRYWGKSAHVVYGLLHNIPDARNKTMILLNLPQSMHGVAMIGAEKNSEYKLMHDLMIPSKPLTNTVYDALAYNMLTPTDGAHVNVINDSTIKVTLNQYATWWWFETRGANSYWTSDYKLDLKDPGHWYELTLRKPADQYLLLYSVGDQWKVVDMGNRNNDQN